MSWLWRKNLNITENTSQTWRHTETSCLQILLFSLNNHLIFIFYPIAAFWNFWKWNIIPSKIGFTRLSADQDHRHIKHITTNTTIVFMTSRLNIMPGVLMFIDWVRRVERWTGLICTGWSRATPVCMSVVTYIRTSANSETHFHHLPTRPIQKVPAVSSTKWWPVPSKKKKLYPNVMQWIVHENGRQYSAIPGLGMASSTYWW